MSDFPNGATSYGVPLIGSGQIPVTTGNYWFVDSGHGNAADAANHGKKSSRPFATIDYAIGKCTASNGDVIIVAPGHAESIASATGCVADIAGITVVGLGNGLNRPVLTLTATTSTISVTAASVKFQNILITAGVDELVSCFTVSGTDCTIDAVDYYESSSSYNCLAFLTTTAAADRLTIKNCNHTQTTAGAGASNWICLVGADDARIVDNDFQILMKNDAATFVVGGLTTASLRCKIHRNNIVAVGTGVIPISMYAGSTGLATYNNVGCSKTSQTGAIALAGIYGAQNFVTNAANTNGILDPAADT
jgi:hypothetical protein